MSSNTFPALYNRLSGTIRINNVEVMFVSKDQSTKFVIPLSSLELKLYGMNTQHFEIKHKFNPDLNITFQDLKVLHALESFGVRSAALILANAKRKALKKIILYTSPIFFILCVLIIVPLILKITPIAWINKLITPEIEEKYVGDILWPVMKQNFKILENNDATLVLKKMSDELILGNSSLKTFNWKIEINDSSEFNAYSLPGARLIFNKGLLKEVDQCSELLGVLAHEMAHTEQRHVLKSLTGSAGMLIGTVILTMISGMDSASVIIKFTNFINLKFSRDDESKADSRGLEYIQNSGYSAQGMISFFYKLSQKNHLPKALSFFSTHPHSEDRALNLKKLLQNEPVKGASEIICDLDVLKQSI